ncbi:GAF domain-containing protein [Lunatibacter salilacus]|uniref:GAF domain-containing protein n=1 Tax=Lunatibacter salilacus TaxID=2483804 RepID=UPI00131C2D6D|nr:GAF domain-containing protein [Lunatibacter salilacus]
MKETTPDKLVIAIQKEEGYAWSSWLQQTLDYFACTTGTLHILDEGTEMLHLKAQVGVPEFLLPKMSEIPIGKGMAGIAAERKEPVQVCNLQTDASGVVRPGAKDTQVEGAITIPLLRENKLYGTLGIAKKEPYEFSDLEIAQLVEIGQAITGKIINGA